ncbi:hypothetical protein B296_00003505 [Ensete ventricosum]|uniref:Uncharacterized protein n=1 Tax=Ensete ventricosum TaxID=4639 RepID=A0A426Z9I1_ENSVE|nr:hypothetical protein B296_00003505 [Ensete ventricosum]
MDDELLQAVKALENARAELPRQAVDRYKESVGFKEGLKKMGRITYEYGYRVALARFHALHPDSEVEEDLFTIHPKDDLVPMERQQAFDDSDPPDDFVTELAQESGRLRELPRLGAVAVPPQAGSPGLGLQATPFAGIPSGEPIGELPNSPEARLGRSTASGGAQVGWTCLSSGRSPIPTRRSGRVGSRRDPSDGQVSSVVDFAIPLLRRGVWAFITTVTGYSYLNPLSSLLLTIPLHLTMPSVVLVARRALAAE